MIKLSVLYPNLSGKKFDMDYYLASHMPMVLKKCGPAIKGVSIEQGMSGVEPGSKAPYRVMAHILFDSIKEFDASFGTHLPEMIKDVPNYTDIQPELQLSETQNLA